ncbi:SRPBCC family protein [Paenibacillus sp. Z3-2]
MNNISTTLLTMKRSFDAPANQVFDAWLNPKLMKKWLFTSETTNKVIQNEPKVGGTWEIVDHREGKDYRAIGEYLEIDPPNRLVLTFEMPQFSDTVDTITVQVTSHGESSEMTFTQHIIVTHEEGWSEDDIEKAILEYNTGSEQGWHLMFEGLKQLLETGEINYPAE